MYKAATFVRVAVGEGKKSLTIDIELKIERSYRRRLKKVPSIFCEGKLIPYIRERLLLFLFALLRLSRFPRQQKIFLLYDNVVTINFPSRATAVMAFQLSYT